MIKFGALSDIGVLGLGAIFGFSADGFSGFMVNFGGGVLTESSSFMLIIWFLYLFFALSGSISSACGGFLPKISKICVINNRLEDHTQNHKRILIKIGD